jgi:ABC-type amino acid transport substrate-binding protein
MRRFAIGGFGLAAAVCCALPAVSQAEDTLSKIRSTKTVTLAYQEGSVPFSFLDDNKKPTGYSVELCLKIVDAIKQELKLPDLNVKYLLATSSTRIPLVTEGRADLECGTTTNTAERRKQVAFTIPHFIATARMIVKADSKIKNWSDLRDKKMALTKGSVQVKMVQERNVNSALNMHFLEGKDHLDSFSMVESGKADAFAMGDVVLYGLKARAKNPDAFAVVGEQLSAEPYAIMFRKDDPGIKSIADREVSRLMTSGELTKIYDKWFKSPLPVVKVSLNMPMGHLLRDSLRFPTDKVAE